MSDRGKSNIFFVRGQWAGVGLAANEVVELRKCFLAGKDRFPSRSRGKRGFQRKLVRARPALIQTCHGLPPTSRSHQSLGIAQRDLHELLGFGESGNGDLGSNRRSSTERGR